MNSNSFTHTPVAPYVPEQDGCTYQRWYGSGKGNRSVYTADREHAADVSRNAAEDKAQVRLRVNCGRGSSADVAVEFGPGELRELARRCLDAAHDLEAVPAKRAPAAAEV